MAPVEQEVQATGDTSCWSWTARWWHTGTPQRQPVPCTEALVHHGAIQRAVRAHSRTHKRSRCRSHLHCPGGYVACVPHSNMRSHVVPTNGVWPSRSRPSWLSVNIVNCRFPQYAPPQELLRGMHDTSLAGEGTESYGTCTFVREYMTTRRAGCFLF